MTTYRFALAEMSPDCHNTVKETLNEKLMEWPSLHARSRPRSKSFPVFARYPGCSFSSAVLPILTMESFSDNARLKFRWERAMLLIAEAHAAQRDLSFERGRSVHMKPCLRIFFLASTAFLLQFSACKESVLEPPAGNWTVRVSVTAYDEFNLAVPLNGSTDVVLTASEWTRRGVVPPGKSSCTFANLPSEQSYSASVQKEGFYSATVRYPVGSVSDDSVFINVGLYPYPSPMARIDSIQFLLNTIVPQVRVRLYTAQTIPAGGGRSAIIFAGLGSNVSPRYGTYIFTLNWVSQSAGTSQILSDDFYRELHHAGAASGARVYITARLTSGATIRSTDPTTGLSIFDNLEENTHVVSSFIMP
jgi:hypothetical protein